MIRRRAQVNDRIRVLVPNADTLAVLPPGTKLEVIGHVPDQPLSCLVDVVHVPDTPLVYHIIVPKGSTVEVHEE